MAAPTVEAVYTSVQGDGGNVGLAVTTDTAPTTDDYLCVCICVNGNGDTITAPGGWTEATVGDNSIATQGGQIRAYYLKNPADSTTYTWTVGTSTRRSIIGLLLRGVDGTTPIDVKGSNQSGPGANHTPPSVTTTGTDRLIVDFAGLRQFSPDTANWTVPASGLTWTERADVQGADGNNNIRLAAGTATAASAGAVSTTVWTNSDVNEDSIIIRIAFAPPAGGSTQDVAPGGIATAEAWGTATITSLATIAPSGIGSGEAWGTAVITSLATISPSGIGTAEAWGTPTLTSLATIAPSGIGTAEAWGTATITSLATISPGSIGSDEAWGTATLTSLATVAPGGIPSGEAWGTATLTGGTATIAPGGIGSGEAWGTPSVAVTGAVAPAGIPSGEAWGTPIVANTSTQFVAPVGIPSAEAWGHATITKLGRDPCECSDELGFVSVMGIPTITLGS